MPSSPVRVVVLAKNLQQFHGWCHETGHSPRDRAILYASGPQALRGLGPVDIVRYGDWWDRLDQRALEDAVGWLLYHRNARLLEAAA